MKVKTFSASTQAGLDDAVNAFLLDVNMVDMHFIVGDNGKLYQQVWFEEDSVQ